jgi:tetratricopeptide (TPR) repeat protein
MQCMLAVHDTLYLTRLLTHTCLLLRMQIRRLDPGQAVETYQRALAADPALPSAWHNLASAHLRLRAAPAAAHALRQALALDPGLTAARHLLASLTHGSGGSGGGSGVTAGALGMDDGGGEAVEAEASDPEARRAYARDLYDFYADGERVVMKSFAASGAHAYCNRRKLQAPFAAVVLRSVTCDACYIALLL